MSPLAPAALLLTALAPPAAPAATPTVSSAAPAPATVVSDPAGTVTIRSASLKRTATSEPVWLDDLSAGFARAAAENRPVLVLFGADWCTYCHKQDAETLSDPAVRRAVADGFVPVRLDVDAHPKLTEALQIDTLPQAVLLSPTAQLLGRAKGFQTAPQFRSALSGAAAKHAESLRPTRVAAGPATNATF